MNTPIKSDPKIIEAHQLEERIRQQKRNRREAKAQLKITSVALLVVGILGGTGVGVYYFSDDIFPKTKSQNGSEDGILITPSK